MKIEDDLGLDIDHCRELTLPNASIEKASAGSIHVASLFVHKTPSQTPYDACKEYFPFVNHNRARQPNHKIVFTATLTTPRPQQSRSADPWGS